MVHERDERRIERRREQGVSIASRHDGAMVLDTTDQLADLPPDIRIWLESAEAPPLTSHESPLRAIERRSWVRNAEREHRHVERFYIVPGLGGVPVPVPAPAPRRGTLLDPDGPLLFTGGCGAVLMHELAGHRAESPLSPLPWPEWIVVRDEPSVAIDDSGLETTPRDLTQNPARSFRRWRAVDNPVPRMWKVDVSVRDGAPAIAIPDMTFVISHIGAGHWDRAGDLVSLLVTSAHMIRDGSEEAVQVPVRVDLPASELVRRLAGGGSTSVAAPAVVCGSHGAEVPVGSESCDLLFADADD